jgi:hypothetical protein
VLRSTDPAGLEQKTWALLTVYQALRRAMVTTVESRPGTESDRASFTTALETAKDLLVNAAHTTDDTDLVGRIGRAVLADLLRHDGHEPASARSNPRSRATTRKTLPARTQHPDHRAHTHNQRPRNERPDTPTEMLDNSTRTLTTRHRD